MTALAVMHPEFPCKRFLSMYRGVPHAHATVLWDLFGSNRACIRRFLAQHVKRPVTLQIHPTCGPCRRNRGYPSQPPPANRDVLRRINRFVSRHQNKNVRFIISLELEDQFGAKEARDVYDKIRQSWPHEIVYNPVRRVSGISADYIELHGKKAKCPGTSFGADLDGSELDWRDVRAWVERNKRCSYLRVWRASWQGIRPGGFTPPTKRSFSIPRRDVREVRRILKGE